MANETKFDGQYPGLGIASVIADSGDTAFSASPATVTATIPLRAGIQPLTSRGKAYVELKGLNAATIVGAIDLLVSDGTNTETVQAIAAPAAASAGRGLSTVVEFFSALANITNIVTVSIRAAASGTTVAGTARLRVLAGP